MRELVMLYVVGLRRLTVRFRWVTYAFFHFFVAKLRLSTSIVERLRFVNEILLLGLIFRTRSGHLNFQKNRI